MKKLLKIAIILIICAVIFAGAAFIIRAVDPKTADSGTTEPIAANADDESLISYTREILGILSARDYTSLSRIAHPERGIVFVPYATVNLASDCCFTPSQIANFAFDNSKYIWGVYDGSGEPVELTPSEYFNEFVFDVDFTKCNNFGINEILRTGNSLENIEEAFPGCVYVDCYMPDPAEEGGPNWQSLRLVFEEYDGKLMLSAIVHNEFTV